MRSRTISACVLLQLLAVVAYGATYIVPTDREMVRRAQAIVIGEALASYTQLNDKGGVETVTPFSVSEVIKGRIHDETVDIYEPGGRYRDHITGIPGVPRFTDGEKALLLLSKRGDGHWAVTDLALGRFTFATDRMGRKVAVRAESDVVGWEPNGQPHKETRRSAAEFIEFIRAEAAGGAGKNNYVVPFEALASEPTTGKKIPAKTLVTYTALSYTQDFNFDGTGWRWNVFPAAVTFKNANGGTAGNTAVTSAVAYWNGAAGAQVNLANGGNDSCAAGCKGLGPADGVNDVLFEQNLQSKYGQQPFNCSSGSWGGLLGLGGVNAASGTHSFASGTWNSTSEGDVEMNTGVLACVGVGPGFNATQLAIAVTHEIGHTLGFRHADQDRTNAGACDSSSYECTSSAVMNHIVPNGATGLYSWDLHAVDLVYPAPALAAPTNLVATAASSTSVSLTWTASSGATSYEVARSADHVNYTTVGTTSLTNYTDSTASANTAYLYEVRAVAPSTSAYCSPDLATTVIFTNATLTPQSSTIKVLDISELRRAVQAMQTLAGQGLTGFGAPIAGVTKIFATDVTDLRSLLDSARAAIGLPALTYAESITASSTTVKASHFNELRLGVQ